MKLEYFRQKKWEDDWIAEAKRLVRDAYNDAVEKATHSNTRQVAANTAQVAGVRDLFLHA